ncbi:MAG: hypothetical protein H7Y12_10560 [Sphingobacteriaceae bacterium]|nr:hypothetical protein [Cytophagaceae bacterium]
MSLILSESVLAQGPTVRFTQLPASFQLIPRSAQNTAEVPVTGRLLESGFSGVSLHVFRDGTSYFHQRQTLSYTGNEADFSLKATIRAELAEYRFEVFGLRSIGDSIQLVRRDSVVCGDAYVVSGQSNAATLGILAGKTPADEYARTFGRFTDGSDAPYNPADTLWARADQSEAQRVGVWAHELQRLIIDTYKIPVCVVNGAFPGAGIQYLMPHREADVTDLSQPYGRLLYRIRKAGIVNQLKATFWWQGELDAYRSIPDYPARFDTLYRAWQRDYGPLPRVYVAQIAIIDDRSDNAGAIRDFQRRTPQLYPNVLAWSSLGTAGFDGLHFNTEGYREHGRQWFTLVARDFYGAPFLPNTTSPTLKKAFYSTPDNREITLVFDEGQSLRWQDDSTLTGRNGQVYTRRMRDYLYLDGNAGAVQALSASGNVAKLTLVAPSAARQLSYLPSWFRDENALQNTYDGPHLRNGRGMAAFSVENVTLGTVLAPPVLMALAQSSTQIRVEWRSIPAGASELLLERGTSATGPFVEVGRYPASPGASTDTGLGKGTTYFYRLRALSSSSESAPALSQASTFPLEVPVLMVTTVGPTQLRLDWQVVASAATYTLERSELPTGPFVQVTVLNAPTLTYLDGPLKRNTTYYYRLKARSVAGESGYGAASGTTLTFDSPELSATAISYAQIHLTWSIPAGNPVKTWALERSPSASGPFVAIAAPDAATMSFTDEKLTPQTTFHYRLRAVAEGGITSTWAIANATTLLLTGLENPNATWRAYPNPARRRLVVDGPGTSGRLRLTDLQGLPCLDLPLRPVSSQEVILPALTRGLYLLRLSDDTHSSTLKVYIEP